MKVTKLPLNLRGRRGVSYWVQSKITAVKYHDDNKLIILCGGKRTEALIGL